MQPYFAPYLGHFDLINQCDEWVIFDTVQYIRHGWVNRNRVLHPTLNWQYLIVPVQKHTRETAIKDISIVAGSDWQTKILGQLQHYRSKAPHFQEVLELMSDTWQTAPSSLAHLNIRLLRMFCERLGIRSKFRVFSEMNLALPVINNPGQWALEISSALGAKEYINPSGGRDLFDTAAFKSRGVKLTIQEARPFLYATKGYNFVPDLSIIDVMMWNSPLEIMAHLSQASIHHEAP